MSRVAIFALCLLLSALVLCCSQIRRFNVNFKPPSPRYRFSVEAAGGARGRRNFNAGGSVRGEYDVYRRPDGFRVVVSGGLARSAARIDGRTYKSRPHREVGIRVDIPFGRGR